jgi:hypothetical protein
VRNVHLGETGKPNEAEISYTKMQDLSYFLTPTLISYIKFHEHITVMFEKLTPERKLGNKNIINLN